MKARSVVKTRRHNRRYYARNADALKAKRRERYHAQGYVPTVTAGTIRKDIHRQLWAGIHRR